MCNLPKTPVANLLGGLATVFKTCKVLKNLTGL